MRNPLENIDVFILCGGQGKRLRKVSRNIPKPMVKIGKAAFLDRIIGHMADFGLRRFILGIGYKAEFVRNYYRENKIPGLEMLFSEEKNPLDTGGALKYARRLIKSRDFFVLNGDSFFKFNPHAFFAFHRRKKSPVSLLLKEISCGREYGEIKLGKASRICSFNEKNIGAKKCLINGGVYIFNKRAFNLMPCAGRFSLEYDFFPKIAGRDIFGYVSSGFFIDIGTPARYLKAKKYLLKQ